jgi:hypothetical protein
MLRKLAIAVLTTVVLEAAPVPTDAASVRALGESGSHGLGHHGSAPGQYRSASHAWPGGARLGGGYGTSHRYGDVSHEGSGWYSRGFGGTTNPGWDYRFGPNLGGLDH